MEGSECNPAFDEEASRSPIKHTQTSSSSSRSSGNKEMPEHEISEPTSDSENCCPMIISNSKALEPDINLIRTSVGDNDDVNFNMNGGYDMTPFQPDESDEDPTLNEHGSSINHPNSNDAKCADFEDANAKCGEATMKQEDKGENDVHARTKECEESLLSSYICDDGGEIMSERYQEQLSRISMYNSQIVDSDSEHEDGEEEEEVDRLDAAKEKLAINEEEEECCHEEYSGLMDDESVHGESEDDFFYPTSSIVEDATSSRNASLLVQVNETFGDFEQFEVESNVCAAEFSANALEKPIGNDIISDTEGWTLRDCGAFEESQSSEKDTTEVQDPGEPIESEETEPISQEKASEKCDSFAKNVPLLRPPPTEKMQAYLLSKGLVQSDKFAAFPLNEGGKAGLNLGQSQKSTTQPNAVNGVDRNNKLSLFPVHDNDAKCRSGSLVTNNKSDRAIASDRKIDENGNMNSNCFDGAAGDRCSTPSKSRSDEEKTQPVGAGAENHYPDDFFNSGGTNLQLSPTAMKSGMTSSLVNSFMKNSPVESLRKKVVSEEKKLPKDFQTVHMEGQKNDNSPDVAFRKVEEDQMVIPAEEKCVHLFQNETSSIPCVREKTTATLFQDDVEEEDSRNSSHLSHVSKEAVETKRRNDISPSCKPPLHPLGLSNHSQNIIEEDALMKTNGSGEIRASNSSENLSMKANDDEKEGLLIENLLANGVMKSKSHSPESAAQHNRRLRSSSFEYHPVSPKMAEKIAVASSKADQKLSDLMLSLSGSKSGEKDHSGDISNLDSPSVGSPRRLSRGAFNTLSNSVTANVSPKESFEKDDIINKCLDLPSIVAAVEVQLSPRPKDEQTESLNDSLQILTKWAHLVCGCMDDENTKDLSASEMVSKLKLLLDKRENMNFLCAHVTVQVKRLNDIHEEEDLDACEIIDEVQAGDRGISIDMDRETLRDAALILLRGTQKLHPFSIPGSPSSSLSSSSMIARSFDTFLRKISQVTGIESPQIERGVRSVPFIAPDDFNDTNSFNEERVQDGVLESLFGQCNEDTFINTLRFLYDSSNEVSLPLSPPLGMADNVYQTDNAIIYDRSTSTDMMNYTSQQIDDDGVCITPNPSITDRKNAECTTTKRRNKRRPRIPDSTPTILIPPPPPTQVYYNVPETSPCPFEISIWNAPDIVLSILEWLGDPVAVCRMKMVNQFCNRIMFDNEYKAMKTAVRLGGIPMYLRPAFWMWVTLEKCPKLDEVETSNEGDNTKPSKVDISSCDFDELERKGRESKWHNIIERDVVRAFGNLPPHKAKGSRRKSIVRALVSWGRSHLKKHHTEVVGKENPIRSLSMMGPPSRRQRSFDDISFEHSDTVSDWGGISPVGSNISSVGSLARTDSLDFVLCGNGLTNEVKMDLQKKLEAILNAIAAAHEGVGYCQGMDYLVAHLLRVLQETVEWNAPRGKLPTCIRSAGIWAENEKIPLHETVVVEETIFRVMHTLMSTYGLRHMYWPELRALKTCCRVFEAIIEKKLPVLYDHFEHHELNIGLFALGWFQTMFLYIPSMPSKTINHIWDIMLVERSMKIFFRVGTAILFLSQPILLNHELEGMMQYLNTFPDATILTHDILINCALQIKITNSMLAEIERWAVRKHERAHGLRDTYQDKMMMVI